MVARYAELVASFPIWSIEDRMAENDDAGWQELTATLVDGFSW